MLINFPIKIVSSPFFFSPEYHISIIINIEYSHYVINFKEIRVKELFLCLQMVPLRIIVIKILRFLRDADMILTLFRHVQYHIIDEIWSQIWLNLRNLVLFLVIKHKIIILIELICLIVDIFVKSLSPSSCKLLVSASSHLILSFYI